MRVLKLHHPKGHPYWQSEEYGVQLPDGSFYKKPPDINNPNFGDECHRILIKNDGIYYEGCGASSGGGKRPSGKQVLIVPIALYDKIEFVGVPLVVSPELREEVSSLYG